MSPAHQKLEPRVARSVKRINTPYAIVLTGTPLENRWKELISIVQLWIATAWADLQTAARSPTHDNMAR